MAFVFNEFVNVGGGCCNPSFYDFYLLNVVQSMEDPEVVSVEIEPIFLGGCEQFAYINSYLELIVKLPPCARVLYVTVQDNILDENSETTIHNFTIQGTTGSLCGDETIVKPNDKCEINFGPISTDLSYLSLLYIGYIL